MSERINTMTILAAVIALLFFLVVLTEKAGYTQMCFRSKRHPAKWSFVGLCLAESLAMLCLAVGSQYTGDKEACVVMGALQHYFFMATFVWLALFNTDLYIQTKAALATKKLSIHPSVRFDEQLQNNIMLSCVAWGVPAIVLLTQLLALDTDGCYDGSRYGGSGFCFINKEYTFWVPYFGISTIFALVGIYYTACWYVALAVAMDAAPYPPKLLRRIGRDLNGAALSLVTGLLAYYCGSFISANNPASTPTMQAIFGVAIIVHSLCLLVYFVAIPAIYDVNTSWGVAAGAQYPVSPDGSLDSRMSLGSGPSVGGGLRPMLVPMNMLHEHSTTSPPKHSADPDAQYRRRQRKLFAQSWVMAPSDLVFFAKRLRAVAPKGRVGADKMKEVYKQCFPNRADEMEAFAAQAFMALDASNTSTLSHHELCIFLAICSPTDVETRLRNIFALYDKNQDEQLSEEEVHNMLERVSEVLNGTGTDAQAIQNRNVVDKMMAELKPLMTSPGPGKSLAMAKSTFLALKDQYNSALRQTIAAEL